VSAVEAVKAARLGGLLARGLIGGATAIIVVVATVLTWPWAVIGPSADERRIADLQRLSHAIDAFRARQHVLPASLARLPSEPAVPVSAFDPVTNRPYDYRPLGPLAYELCARFDRAGPEERKDFWWHDGGRYCFALEAWTEPKLPSATPAPPTPTAPTPAPPAPEPAAAPPEPAAPPPASPPTDPPAAPAPEGAGPPALAPPR
jgi:hypothetical protein